jgi:hypothetical protein
MKTDPVQTQDEADHALGLEIIRVLQLKRKRDNGRIETTHGDKNPCGLARTVRHLSAGPLEKAAPELLAALVRFTDDLEDCYGGENQMKHSDATRYRQARAAITKAQA